MPAPPYLPEKGSHSQFFPGDEGAPEGAVEGKVLRRVLPAAGWREGPQGAVPDALA